MISDATHTHKIKCRMATATEASTRRRLFASKLNLNLRKKLIKCYIWSIVLYGAETCTHQKVDQKYVESSEMWCCTISVGPPV